METMRSINLMIEIDDYVMKLNPEKTVLFFDIDNTLLRIKSDIGSTEWVKWQDNMLRNCSDKCEYAASDTLHNFYMSIQKWLTIANYETEPAEEYITELIDKYISLGFKIILITARDKYAAGVTLQQLSQYYNINQFYSSDLYFQNDSALHQNGVYFASGMNKGDCMEKLLAMIKLVFDYEPENIIFIDDSMSECNSVAQKFNNHKINATVFNYLYCSKYQFIFDQLDKNDLHNQWIDFVNIYENTFKEDITS